MLNQDSPHQSWTQLPSELMPQASRSYQEGVCQASYHLQCSQTGFFDAMPVLIFISAIGHFALSSLTHAGLLVGSSSIGRRVLIFRS